MTAFLLTPFRAATWRRTLTAVLLFPFSVLAFVLTLVCFLVGLALCWLWAGIPVWVLGFTLARWSARLARAALGGALGRPVPEPPARAAPRGMVRRLRWHLTDPVSRRAAGYVVAAIPLAAVSAFLAVYVWVQTAYSLSYPFWAWNAPDMANLWGGPTRTGVMLVHFLPGVAALFLGPWLVTGLLRAQSALAGDRRQVRSRAR